MVVVDPGVRGAVADRGFEVLRGFFETAKAGASQCASALGVGHDPGRDARGFHVDRPIQIIQRALEFAHFRIYLSAAAESCKRRFLLQLQDPVVIVQCLHVMFRIPVGRGAEQVGRAASRSGMDGLGSAGNGLLIILAVVMKGGLRQESLNRIDFGVAGIELGGLLKILPGFFLFAHVDPCAARPL